MALNKIYTLQSLRNWFKAYRKEWWAQFSNSDVKLGDSLLGKGAVKTFDLQSNYLLVCGDKEGITYFSTIDLNNGQIRIQMSAEDSKFAKGLSAAALCLLEKLFEDHLDFLSLDEVDKIIPIEDSYKKIVPVSGQDATVKLVFRKKDQAIFFEIFFKRHDAFEKLSSLNQVIKPHEREVLLSIMLASQKYGFCWNKEGLLSSKLEVFPQFVTELLSKFSQKYFVECPDYIKNLGKPNAAVKLTLESGNQGILQQKFFLNRRLLNTKLVMRSLHAKNHIYWSEQHGFIKIQENALNWLQRINDWKNRFSTNKLSAYLLLSVFNPNAVSDKAKSWINSLQEKSQYSIDLPSVPLQPYQKEGVLWLKHILDSHCHPLLADEMGLGKTRQLLSLIQIMMQQADDSPFLIICPASVIGVWQNEGETYFKQLTIEVLTQEVLRNYKGGKKIFIASYSQLLINSQVLKRMQFNCVILDEAQFMKNPKSKTAYACFNLKAKYRVASTGTPLENNLIDLWTIFHFLMPGLLGNFKEFQRFIQTETNYQRLKQQVAPFILRRTQKEVLKNLPDKNEFVVYCPMTRLQKDLYYQALQLRSLVKEGQWVQLLTLILRLRQICCDPGILPEKDNIDIKESGKLAWLLEKLSDRASNFKKVIIFSQFTKLLERLRSHIKCLFPETYILTGKTPTKNRCSIIRNFQTTKEKTAFLISLKAGGTGITLHAADTLFILDPWWNPAVEQQAVARAHRLGQNKSLTVYRLLIENSIESNIQKLQNDKSKLFNQLFEEDKLTPSLDRWQQLYTLLSLDEKTKNKV